MTVQSLLTFRPVNLSRPCPFVIFNTGRPLRALVRNTGAGEPRSVVAGPLPRLVQYDLDASIHTMQLAMSAGLNDAGHTLVEPRKTAEGCCPPIMNLSA